MRLFGLWCEECGQPFYDHAVLSNSLSLLHDACGKKNDGSLINPHPPQAVGT